MEADFPDAAPTEPGAMNRFLAAVWNGVVRWGVRIGVAVMVVLVALVYLHVIEDKPVLLALFSALILLLSEQLRTAADHFEARISNSDALLNRKITSVTREMNNHSKAIKELIENSSLQLYSLNQCVEQIADTLRTIPHNEPVVIEHLGLDLTQAWEYMERILKSDLDIGNIEYRILILTDEPDKIPGADVEVITWSRSAAYIIERIKKEGPIIKANFSRTHKNLNMTLRKYAAVPVIHGFRILRPNKECYMAICRWGGDDYKRYEWGDPQYHKIVGDVLDPVSRDMYNIFDGYFEHLWNASSNAEFSIKTENGSTGVSVDD
jgi:hypothetical protein